MADKKTKKPVAKKAPVEQPAIMIVIGAKSKVAKPKGCQLWQLDGIEVTDDGDRRAVATLTSRELHKLGWVRRKY
ncbi:MAG TPA: hypothetical protein EYN66_02555 [Myxococcales bacterium]|nr:hypothetical protein [Myxococcales bacterium]